MTGRISTAMLSGFARFAALGLVLGITIYAQAPAITALVNAASQRSELSPGVAAVVQGGGFTSDAVLHVGGIKVTPVGGSVLPSRFNVQLPPDLPPGAYQATITTAAGTSAALGVTVAAASPAFFTVTREGVAQGAFFDDTPSNLSTSKGAAPGAVIGGYATGLGPADAQGPVGSAALPLRVSIRGESGRQSVAATAQQEASLPGYWQVRFTMPEGLRQGMHDVYLTAGGVDGPAAALPVGGAILSAVVNAATNAKDAPVAPGSMVAVVGTSLVGTEASGLFPATQLPGGGEIRIGGMAAPLYDISAKFSQAHAMVPLEAPESGTVEVEVNNPFGISQPFRLQMAATAVGIFRIQDPAKPERFNAAAVIAGTGWVAMPNATAAALRIPQDCRAGGVDTQMLCGQPASVGDVLQIYVTGLGRVVAGGDPPGPALVTGAVAPANGSVVYRSAAAPQVAIGGVAATVLFSGLAPGFAGLYQVDVAVPKGVTPGDDVAVTISMPAGDRDSATIAVR